MNSLGVHVVGDIDSPAMWPVRAYLEILRTRGALIQRGDSPPAGRIRHTAAENSRWFPDLVVICQHWPDEFSGSLLQTLLTDFPLARLVCCYGPWCESDGRNQDVWPLAIRVPVSFAAARIGRELEVIAGTRPPLPLTASRDEIFLFDAEDDLACRFEAFAIGGAIRS